MPQVALIQFMILEVVPAPRGTPMVTMPMTTPFFRGNQVETKMGFRV